MFNSIQIFGMALLGGLGAGEFSRRALALPRTTGYVVFGLLVGQSGLAWIVPYHVESNQLFIDLALGLILFELGYQVPLVAVSEGWNRLKSGLLISLTTGATVLLALLAMDFSASSAVFATALCLATSPAITIATCSDVGARGEKTGLLFTMVAIDGCIALVVSTWSMPLLVEGGAIYSLAGAWRATQEVGGAVMLGGACTALVLTGAQLLGRRSEHQHLLILGTIVLGVGTAIHLDISAFLPMLLFGYLTRALDRNKQVVAIRIASDARIFLVATFVLAGAALDIGVVVESWPDAVLVIIARFAGQLAGVLLNRNRLRLGTASSIYLSIGLQPMSSIALVLLANMQTLYSGLEPRLTGALLATIILMQLFGPLATQTAIKGFGEATHLQSDDPAAEKPASQQGSCGDKS
ncbi:MAG: cation:proton antiporter [Candidatus Accumulibacter phosphatis]|uniref:Sodium/hydrogen exchanger family protein n=2 Tax=Candidatus Accumulibacter TaxID=327159 RepID=A0A080MBK3_9PROT|nr:MULTISPECIES: cation:proton antiporter [Candidatus Accumulibacter]KFB77830.1 MAG: Sodium/hydrogen exchanger family protein [Candidatus Accumulibacter cognatus]MBL8401057.1 cation:proton antiporter [Accumulibacter sp.]MCC2867034.1 cation:proton antiporter [Candidatus Accumulibacter phosphatis]MCQ1549330.1 cation:proton antiporter [Candidatus Accumulibacter phosphatis]